MSDMHDAAASAADHRIHLFFDFTYRDANFGDRLTALSLGDVRAADWIHPSRLAADAARPIAHRPLWTWAAWDVSPDLHSFVHAILNSRRDDATTASRLELTPYGANVLAGKYRHGAELAGEASSRPAAEQLRVKIGAAAGVGEIPIAIESAAVHLVRTGVGIVVVTLRLEPGVHGVAAAAFVEALPRLCDERGAPHLSWGDRTETEAFTLGSIVRALVEPAGCEFAARERTYSFCALVFDSMLPAAQGRELAFRLSRHYNSRYRPSPEFTGTSFVRPFETVLHAMSREGVCTIVDRTLDEARSIEFLGTWLMQAHARVYLPLQIAALHEHVVLLQLAQGAGRHIDPDAKTESDVVSLKELSKHFLLFRLRYRLSQVSNLTNHDLAYAATESALGLVALTEKIARDLLAVEQRLIQLAAERAADDERARAQREVEQQRRFAWFTALSTAGLAYLVFNNIAAKLKPLLTMVHLPPTSAEVEIWTQLIALAVAAGAFIFAQRRQHVAPQPNRLLRNALEDIRVTGNV